MIWRKLRLIAYIGDDGLEEIEVVNFDCEIRKQAQFPPRRQRQRASISPSWPQRDQPSHDSANAFAIQRNAISNDMIVPICCLPFTDVVGRHLPSGSLGRRPHQGIDEGSLLCKVFPDPVAIACLKLQFQILILLPTDGIISQEIAET